MIHSTFRDQKRTHIEPHITYEELLKCLINLLQLDRCEFSRYSNYESNLNWPLFTFKDVTDSQFSVPFKVHFNVYFSHKLNMENLHICGAYDFSMHCQIERHIYCLAS